MADTAKFCTLFSLFVGFPMLLIALRVPGFSQTEACKFMALTVAAMLIFGLSHRAALSLKRIRQRRADHSTLTKTEGVVE